MSTLPARFTLALLLLPLALGIFGCRSQYVVPGPAADMAAFGVMTEQERTAATDWHIRGALSRQPLAAFPTNLAVVRVQGSGFRSQACGRAYGQGAYSVVTVRDVETDEHFEKLEALPMVSGVATVNRLLLPQELKSDRQLRSAAAALHADMLLVYTFDTNIYWGDLTSPIDVITFGFLPHSKVKVVTTVSAALLDTRNGYVYGLAEGTAEDQKLANTWTSAWAADQSRLKTEREAFAQMLDEFTRTWKGVVETYASTGPRQTVRAAAVVPHRAIVVETQARESSTVPPGARYETTAR